MKDNSSFSTDNSQKTQPRNVKTRNKARYRRIKKYYKSVNQYKKERLRRKLCWLLSGTITHEQIGEMLGISKRTVIRDINKIRPYYERMFRSYCYKLQADRFREVQAKLATMSLMEQYKYLTELMIEEREQRRFRQYRRHFTILTLDMIKADSYGIPKLTISPVGTLAYPHKVRVHFKTENYLVDLGGFRLVQTRGW